jgi:hypothetical protein
LYITKLGSAFESCLQRVWVSVRLYPSIGLCDNDTDKPIRAVKIVTSSNLRAQAAAKGFPGLPKIRHGDAAAGAVGPTASTA